MFNRRRFLQMAAAIPASAVIGRYQAMAAPLRKLVKVTDLKCMMVRGLGEWPLVRVETDAGITGIGEAYHGEGIKCDYMVRTGEPDERFSRHWTSSDLRRNATAFTNIREAVGDDVDIAVHCHWEFDWIDATSSCLTSRASASN